MLVELDPEEVQILADLVESRTKEMHPEIRHSRIYTVHDELKQDLAKLEKLLERLRQLPEE